MSETIETAPVDPAAAEPVAPVATPPTADHHITQLVAAWVLDCIHNSPVSQSTDALNHLTTVAIPELLRRLSA